MSQGSLGTLIAAETSGTDLAARLVAWQDALHTQHSGSSRPSYLQAGGEWLDTSITPWVLKFWTGVVDVDIMSIDPATGVTRNLKARPANTVYGRVSEGEGPGEDLTPAQLRSILQSDTPNVWVTVAAAKLTAGAAAIIIPIPSGRKSLRVQGMYRMEPDVTLQGRISTDGGATYRSAANSYWSGQRTTQNGAGGSSADGVGATSMMLGTNGRGNVALPSVVSFFAEFDETACAQFVYSSVGSNTQNHRLISSGLSRTDFAAVPTHVMLFPSVGSFMPGTRVNAEAF